MCYIKLVTSNKIIVSDGLSHQCIETYKLKAPDVWMRDNTGLLHIESTANKPILIIECKDTSCPSIDNDDVGQLCLISLKTRVYQNLDEDNIIHAAYKQLAKHDSDDTTKFDYVENVSGAGMYSYMPVVQMYLQSYETIQDEKTDTVKWKLYFEGM